MYRKMKALILKLAIIYEVLLYHMCNALESKVSNEYIEINEKEESINSLAIIYWDLIEHLCIRETKEVKRYKKLEVYH
jgi:hypothetical protein